VIENMSIPNSNMCNDKFIDQLVNITHDMIVESPFKCPSKSRSSRRTSDVIVNQEFQPLPTPPLVGYIFLKNIFFVIYLFTP
jgi:hypothetical protein